MTKIFFAFFLLFYNHFANAIDLKKANKIQTATFAAGCFWGVEEFFRKISGVTKTTTGYTGGVTVNPKYDDMHDGKTGHAEAVQLEFDSTKATYQFLLDQFFKMHDPTTLNKQGYDIGNQYRSAIFYADEMQHKIATEFKQKVEKSGEWKSPIVTEIAIAQKFWPAEKYHQSYLVKNPGGYDNHFLRKLNFDKK